jgi:hypothetical protein
MTQLLRIMKKSILPYRTIFILIFLWLVLSILYFWLKFINYYPNQPRIFPISVISKSTANQFSVIPLILIIFLIGFTLRYKPKNIWLVYVICLVFILLGNLLQGGVKQGFINALLGRSINQPFFDAIRIQNGYKFLHDFNVFQLQLSKHARTHPPFLLLLYFILNRFGGIPGTFIGCIFIVSVVFFIFYQTLVLLDIAPQKAAKLTFLLALIPSVNIYSVYSWDALAAVGYSLFLWGIVSIYKKGLSWINLLLLFIGFLFANMMNYLALGLIGIIGIVALWDFYKSKRLDLLIATIFIIMTFGIVIVIWKIGFNYNHIRGILTSIQNESEILNELSNIERIKIYFFSRLEDIGEVSVFLSFGVLAVLLNTTYRKLDLNLKSIEGTLLFSGILFFVVLMIIGVFRTGETARPFIWLVPYFLIALKNIEDRTLNACIGVAAVQTITMQLTANFYW